MRRVAPRQCNWAVSNDNGPRFVEAPRAQSPQSSPWHGFCTGVVIVADAVQVAV